MMLVEGFSARQAGMVLLISLVFVLLLSLIGVSSMQEAVTQQKVTGSLWHRNRSHQSAESGLRLGERDVQRTGAAMPRCQSITRCAPPDEAFSVIGAGTNPASAVTWIAFDFGVYGVQSLGAGTGMANFPPQATVELYRVTAVGLSGRSRAVLETVYARVEEEGGSRFRRVAWRQLQ
ncbi:MAG: PilX N-terminal domain-containing pilus assembly protein [Pseudomonas sp.]|uniref:pilus assembly PilX family protein n=1 Tax=Pseudomonas sp. TaxID=306 RepID=UPI00391DBA75